MRDMAADLELDSSLRTNLNNGSVTILLNTR
jgi:hypothetical protein